MPVFKCTIPYSKICMPDGKEIIFDGHLHRTSDEVEIAYLRDNNFGGFVSAAPDVEEDPLAALKEKIAAEQVAKAASTIVTKGA